MKGRKKLLQRWILGDYLLELADLLDAGASLNDALLLVADDERMGAMELQFGQVAEDVSKGEELGNALSHHFAAMPPFCVDLILQAERDGRMPEQLAQLGSYMEAMHSLRPDGNALRRIFLYPIAVFIVGTFVLSILMLFVMPQFEVMFSSFGADLPILTQSVIDVSHFLADYWWLLLLVILLPISGWKLLSTKSRSLMRLPGALLLRLPLFSTLFIYFVNAELARTLSFFANSDASSGDMAKAAGQALSSGYARDEINQVAEQTRSGSTLAEALAHHPVFSHKLVQLIRIGESHGLSQRLLQRIADRYARQLRESRSIVGILEPLILAILGVIIGTVVIAMYLPIFMIGGVV